MSEVVEQIRNQLNEYIQGLDKNKKIKIGLSALFILISLTGIIYFFSRPDYVVLYNNLNPEESGSVMETLQGSNIRADFGDTSGTILVRKQDEKRAQVVVATQGLPTARFSYEDAFSGNSWMMTSEERAQRILIAQQNYLASTMEEIPGVSKAVVNLTIPERTGFMMADNNANAKASVWLDISSNANLESGSIKGIAILVSNAVQGLEPENVTIHGPDGRVLNQEAGSDSSLLGASDQMNLQQAVQKDLEKSITDFLSSVYGHGNVVVMAGVRLGFDSNVTELVEFAPPIEGQETGIIRSMHELTHTAIDGPGGGIPGVDPNVGDIPQNVEDDEYLSRYDEASQTINYEINELRQKIVKAHGQVHDISVAVYVNKSTLADGDLSDQERRELINIVSAAAGLDTRVVQVGVQEFNDSLADQWQLAMDGNLAAGEGGQPWWLIGLLATLILGAAYIVINKVRKNRSQEEEILVQDVMIPDELEEINLDLSGSQVKQQIEKLVNKKPDAVAQMLKNWINEE
ncbi:flagellar M-ring protein FliF [Alkaliphilus metalliredigens QYMF]|uniref:Flagellar M-ring protein n=1 Tax=Alkaliphilus metalliredigens (strain QYMF) TaxID=293826 RepID=A6TKW7_ALKMQ|nr:flagellar basal-body MS-ring/collar protein FliF [Alkaliphilus metalliredigens]ABR46835.1 flagellar M-ring protein FliF [Alkaliphilus metalliredigens QYMF]